MLTQKDADEVVNGKIAIALSRWGDSGANALHADAATGAGVTRIRQLMEASGRGGTVRSVSVDGKRAFVYLCFTSRSEPFAQGTGDSPELAIVDAFLRCSERIVVLPSEDAPSGRPAVR
jgi:hypothetical protein